MWIIGDVKCCHAATGRATSAEIVGDRLARDRPTLTRSPLPHTEKCKPDVSFGTFFAALALPFTTHRICNLSSDGQSNWSSCTECP